MHKPLTALAVAAALGLWAGAAAEAKTFRWSSQGDYQTMDPHAYNEGLNNSGMSSLFDPLVRLNKEYKPEPALATEWKQLEPTRYRFTLRRGVKYHDGAPFTAEDVVFSIGRALAPSSQFAVYTQGIKEAVKVDDFTVDIILSGPNPTLLGQLTELRIMNKAWSEKHNVMVPQSFKDRQETYAVRNANGTGPYILKTREADVQTVFVANPNWWGKKDGNVTEVIYRPIKSAATRVAALLSGELDFVLDPPVQDLERLKQDPNMKVVEGFENRTIFLGFDHFRPELTNADVKGKNPFQDLRVRQAFYHAINIEAIKSRVMRGLSVPAGLMIAPGINGYTKEADQRFSYDPEKSKKLLAEAGYANGFEVLLECPNDRYINDEAICQAVTAMLNQVGVRVKLQTQPRGPYFAKLQRHESSFFMLGWGVPTYDALYTLQSLMRTKVEGTGDGNWNAGRYSNPALDQLVDQVKVEANHEKRTALIHQALKMQKDDVVYIPLHHQVIPWVMKKNVDVFHTSDNRLEMRWVTVH